MTIRKQYLIEQSHLILARLARTEVPRELDKLVKQLRTEHEALSSLHTGTIPAQEARRLARLRANEAGEAVDASIAELANVLSMAGIGDRFSPLAAVGAPAPADVARQRAMRKVTAAREVIARVGTLGRLPPTVKKAIMACEAAEAALVQALDARDAAEQALSRAIASRDAKRDRLAEGLRKLEARARVAWEDAPEVVQGVFAPVRRAPKKRAPADEPVSPAPTEGVPIVPLSALPTTFVQYPPALAGSGPALRGPFVFCS